MQNLTDALRTIGLSDSPVRTAFEVTPNTAAHYPVLAAISKKEVMSNYGTSKHAQILQRLQLSPALQNRLLKQEMQPSGN